MPGLYFANPAFVSHLGHLCRLHVLAAKGDDGRAESVAVGEQMDRLMERLTPGEVIDLVRIDRIFTDLSGRAPSGED